LINEFLTASFCADVFARDDSTTIDVEQVEKTINNVVAKPVNATSAIVASDKVWPSVNSAVAVLEDMNFSSRIMLESRHRMRCQNQINDSPSFRPEIRTHHHLFTIIEADERILIFAIDNKLNQQIFEFHCCKNNAITYTKISCKGFLLTYKS
jgi:hypothetical protein